MSRHDFHNGRHADIKQTFWEHRLQSSVLPQIFGILGIFFTTGGVGVDDTVLGFRVAPQHQYSHNFLVGACTGLYKPVQGLKVERLQEKQAMSDFPQVWFHFA